MFTQPQTVLLALLLAAPLYWLIPPTWPSVRKWLLIFISLSLIAFESTLAVGACVVVTLWTFLSANGISIAKGTKLGEKVWIKRILFWIAMGGLVTPLILLDIREEPLAILGLSYIIIKSASVIIDAGATGKSTNFGTVLILNSFFPIFSAGPIEDQSTFDRTVFENRPTSDTFIFGVYRMLEGFILSFFVGQHILLAITDGYGDQAYINPDISGLSIVGLMLLKFTYVYVNFTGYTSFAIGLAAFFGIRIKENFRYPFLARNPEEFWSRWHMSLGQFLSKYLYFRMLVLLKRPQISLFLAFVLVGLWHSIGLQYLLWGAGHGGYLIVFLILKRRYAKSFANLPRPARIAIGLGGWAFTMLWVSFLSFMANAPSMEALGTIIMRVF